MITVMGAGGNTGGKIARSLLLQGHGVRVIGRNASKLAPLVECGAQRFVGDAFDRHFLTTAFSGADAAYVLLAPDASARDYAAAQDEMGEAICGALRDGGVARVVALSSLGADKTLDTGVIAGLHRQEDRLRTLQGVDLYLLRPASFFENLAPQIAAAREQRVIADVIEPSLPVPMVATKDIAAAAVHALSQESWRGVLEQELLGPSDITHAEIADRVARLLNIEGLVYVRLSDDEMVEALTAAGSSPNFAAMYVKMAHAINDRALEPVRGRTSANTTATGFDEFVREFVQREQSG